MVEVCNCWLSRDDANSTSARRLDRLEGSERRDRHVYAVGRRRGIRSRNVKRVGSGAGAQSGERDGGLADRRDGRGRGNVELAVVVCENGSARSDAQRRIQWRLGNVCQLDRCQTDDKRR